MTTATELQAQAERLRRDRYDELGPQLTVRPLAAQHHRTEPVVADDMATPGLENRVYAPTDIGNSERVVDRFGRNMRYVYEWKAWLVWNGNRWEIDKRQTVNEKAKAVALGLWGLAFSDTALRGHARHASSVNGVAAMLKLAESDPGVAVVVNDLDQHEHLLPVANGTVNLKTGVLEPSRRGDLMTKGSEVPFLGGERFPHFESFLRRVLPDPGVREFVQRAVGYSLTGSVAEQCLFFCHGSGRNGKSTLGDLLFNILGDLAAAAPEGLIDGRAGEYAIADLHGRRLVMANETTSDGRVAEARLKEITGADKLNGARKYGHPFTFQPTHTLWIRGNYRPRIEGTDEGIWRRLYLIPFEVQIPEDEKDPRLPEKLRSELPGILAWAVEGAAEWYRGGLRPPSQVLKATSEYRQDQDVLGRFMSERLQFAPSMKATSAIINDALEKWCDAEGVVVPSKRAVAKRLEERDLHSKKSNGHVWWIGVGLLDEQSSLNQ